MMYYLHVVAKDVNSACAEIMTDVTNSIIFIESV